MKSTILLTFSDTELGTAEFGYVSRKPGQDPDDEDARYQSHLKKMGVVAQVRDGKVYVAG